MTDTENWVVGCGVEDLDVGEVISIECEGRTLAVYRVSEDLFYSTDDICSHGYTHLSQGFFEDCTTDCPLHGGQWKRSLRAYNDRHSNLSGTYT
ncbi:Rieske 2Fe-2S domain-containing protein [Ensifer sp. B1-9]|uniref:Rieske 2Fe-2S domain-containing protein n=1 Tax=Ensifer sp. B1-9 TaxID=3141455 RepID=UPI003D206738